jgi:hypothetical protein
MDIFKIIPNIQYGSEELKNIFFKYIIKNNINREFLSVYRLKDGQSLEEVSYELYGKVDYWWIIAFINKIDDVVFDIPINEKMLKFIAKENSLKDDGSIDYEKYSIEYEKLQEENEKKRVINIIREEHLSEILTDIIRFVYGK